MEENKMECLKFTTKGNVNSQGKPRVYFTCHPADFKKSFDKICNDIFKTHDCAIYYTEDMNAEITDSNKSVDLNQMNLFVIPVTFKLLNTPNRAMDSDFIFAKEHHIPILPIMLEIGIDEFYSKEDKFGELQYLSPYEYDITAISYEEKLKKYLESVLISDEMAEKIRAAFDAYIFLSYRKKDRKYANELMRIIHSNPLCQNIAIWYDEFLTPGESFKENIDRILSNSKLFTLLVTPNLLEEPNGKPNFIMENEYPAAIESGLDILPAEMVETDKYNLEKKFNGIPKCLNIDDEESRERLINSISRYTHTESNDSEHNYLIGLAYLEGIDVEVNRERGLELITKSANKGLTEAIYKLAQMYYYGIYVSKSMDDALYWQERLINNLEIEACDNSSVHKRFELADALRFYCEIKMNRFSENDDINVLVEYCNKALNLCDQVQLTDTCVASHFVESRLRTQRMLAIVYEHVNDFDKALYIYNKALCGWHEIEKNDKDVVENNVSISNRQRIAQIYHDVGILYSKKGEYPKSIDNFNKSLAIYQQISNETVDYVPNIINVHNSISESAKNVDICLANKHNLVAVEQSKSLYESNPTAFGLLYSKTMLSRLNILSEMGSTNLNELENIGLEIVKLLEIHHMDGSCETNFNLMNIYYKLAGIYRRKADWANAERYYSKSIKISDILINRSDINIQESIAHLLFDYGSFSSTGFLGKANFEKSKILMEKALELFKSVSIVKQNCQKWVDETETALQIINELINTDVSYSINKKMTEIDSKKLVIIYEFKYLYEKGDFAETAGDYSKAYFNYKAALEQLELLEEIDSTLDNLTYADIYDRLALCCEMLKNIDDAKDYYCLAVMRATSEVCDNGNENANTAMINYIKKLASFCEDYGMEEDAFNYYNILENVFGITKEESLNNTDVITQENDDEDFLSDDLRVKIEKGLDELDFTPSTFKEGEEIDYCEDLLLDVESDNILHALFDTLFDELKNNEDND